MLTFPNPRVKECSNCHQPTAIRSTPIGEERVHCGTWQSKCNDADGTTERVVSRME